MKRQLATLMAAALGACSQANEPVPPGPISVKFDLFDPNELVAHFREAGWIALEPDVQHNCTDVYLTLEDANLGGFPVLAINVTPGRLKVNDAHCYSGVRNGMVLRVSEGQSRLEDFAEANGCKLGFDTPWPYPYLRYTALMDRIDASDPELAYLSCTTPVAPVIEPTEYALHEEEVTLLNAIAIANREEVSPIDGISGYIAAGLLPAKPTWEADYTRGYLARKGATFQGYPLVAIAVEDVWGPWIGCCVNRGWSLVLQTGTDTQEGLAFARDNGCVLEAFEDGRNWGFSDIGIAQHEAEDHKLSLLQCHELDLIDSALQ